MMAGSSMYGNARGPGNVVIDGPRAEGVPRKPRNFELWQPPVLNSRLHELCKERGWNRLAMTSGQRAELLAIIDTEPVPADTSPEPGIRREPPREFLSKKSGGTGGGGLPPLG